jgi:hypothetical protein
MRRRTLGPASLRRSPGAHIEAKRSEGWHSCFPGLEAWWRRWWRRWWGEEVGRVGLRAISGLRRDHHLKGNSGFFASALPLKNQVPTTIMMAPNLPFPKASLAKSNPLQCLYYWNHGSPKEMSPLGLDKYGKPPTCH